jgi:hypothetical protein
LSLYRRKEGEIWTQKDRDVIGRQRQRLVTKGHLEPHGWDRQEDTSGVSAWSTVCTHLAFRFLVTELWEDKFLFFLSHSVCGHLSW